MSILLSMRCDVGANNAHGRQEVTFLTLRVYLNVAFQMQHQGKSSEIEAIMFCHREIPERMHTLWLTMAIESIAYPNKSLPTLQFGISQGSRRRTWQQLCGCATTGKLHYPKTTGIHCIQGTWSWFRTHYRDSASGIEHTSLAPGTAWGTPPDSALNACSPS